MLESVDSRELAEWMAYDAYTGALNNAWRDEVNASQQELLQRANYLFELANTDKAKRKSVNEPKPLPRPGSMWDE